MTSCVLHGQIQCSCGRLNFCVQGNLDTIVLEAGDASAVNLGCDSASSNHRVDKYDSDDQVVSYLPEPFKFSISAQ